MLTDSFNPLKLKSVPQYLSWEYAKFKCLTHNYISRIRCVFFLSVPTLVKTGICIILLSVAYDRPGTPYSARREEKPQSRSSPQVQPYWSISWYNIHILCNIWNLIFYNNLCFNGFIILYFLRYQECVWGECMLCYISNGKEFNLKISLFLFAQIAMKSVQ